MLWTNPSPTVAFSAQDVVLDLSNYTGVIIETESTDTTTCYGSRVYIQKGETKVAGQAYKSNNYAWSRVITVSATKVTFASGQDRAVAENTVCVPTKIYGVNLNL